VRQGEGRLSVLSPHFPEPYQKRWFACGMALYDALGIERAHKEAQTGQWPKNYYGVGAPVELYFFVYEALAQECWSAPSNP